MHFHDGIGDKLTPIDQGDIDHRTAVELLSALPYEGYLSGEWISWKAAADHLPQELATMKTYEPTDS